MRLRLALILVGVVGTLVVPAIAATARGAERLPGGLVISSGSRLFGGTVFPYAREGDFRGSEAGWTAMLAVTGSAATVYDAYAQELRERGVPIEWSDKACQSDGPANVRCVGGDGSGEQRAEIDLRVCASCSPVTALALIHGRDIGKSSEAIPGEPPALRTPQFEVQIDAKQLRAAPLPIAGQPIGTQVPTRVVKGSRALATGDIFDCGSGSYNAVLKVTGDRGSVYRRYVAQLPRSDDERVHVTNGRMNGHPAAEAANVYGSIVMAEGDDGPAIVVSRCNDD
jgi:hypothetical protein